MKKFVFEKESKKVSKKVKKGVDKPLKEWYYSQARSSGTPLERAPNLENDTETRNANDSQ